MIARHDIIWLDRRANWNNRGDKEQPLPTVVLPTVGLDVRAISNSNSVVLQFRA